MNSKRVLSIALILSIFTIFIANQTSVVSDSTNSIYVGGIGDGNYTIIQKAVNNASDGDTIYVYSGIFYENIIINKSITLIGENKHTTILQVLYEVGFNSKSTFNSVFKKHTGMTPSEFKRLN